MNPSRSSNQRTNRLVLHFSQILAILTVSGPWFLWSSLASPPTSRLQAVAETGPRSERINLVFLSEGYTEAQLPQFIQHVQTATDYLFTRQPWREYRSYCNVYRIEIASNQSGTDNGSHGTTRDTYFNSGFTTPSVPQLLTVPSSGQSRAYALLNQHLPEYDQPILLVNDPTYGGSGGSIAVASIHNSSRQLVEHEIGHSFAGLTDEYDFDYPPYTPTESYNATQETDRQRIRWRSWIENSTPIPTPATSTFDATVGLFEGANYRAQNWYRPHRNSLMRSLGQPVGAVNRERFVLAYYEKVRPLDSFHPASPSLVITQSVQLDFSISPKIPSLGPPLTVQWSLNGQPIPSPTPHTLTTFSGDLGNGVHTLSVHVADPTPFVRDDPQGLLTESLSWTLNVSHQLPASLADWRTLFGPDHANPSGDGLDNLMKYALGLDPRLPALPNQRPQSETFSHPDGSRYLSLRIPRTHPRPDIDYLVRSASDLVSWQSGPGHTVVMEETPTLLLVRDAQPANQAQARFLELRVRPR
jgi:hypothetical protein